MAKPKKPKSPPVGVPKARNNGPIIAGVGAVAAVLVLIAVLLSVGGSDDSSEDVSDAELIQQQSVAVTGTPLAQAPEDNQPDTAVGTVAPDLAGKNFSGQPVEIKNDGRPKVVMFFAHWCPHCQRELPELTQFIKANGSKYPVDYYAVSTDVRSSQDNYPPSAWFTKEGFTGPILADSSQKAAANAYGIGGYPFITYLDAQNKVVARTSGELPVSTFESNVSKLAPGAPR